MNASLEQLQTLQEIFTEKFALYQRIEEIPKQCKAKEEVVNRLQRDLANKQELLGSIEEKLRLLNLRLSENQQQRYESEKRMALIKTQREFELLEKEIDAAAHEEENMRKEINKDQRQTQELKAEIETDESLIKTQTEELVELQKQMNEAISQDEARIKELEQNERAVSPDLTPELLYKLETIMRNKKGLAIVPLRGSICRGCNMVLPAQFVNNVRAAEEIKFCPSCNRVLYYEAGGEDYSQVLFDDNDLGGLSDLMDDEDEFDEDSPFVDPDDDMSDDYDDN